MLRSVMDDVVEPAADDMRLPKVLAALADPHRLASVCFLARNGESWCAQVMKEAGLEMSKSTFSHHLRILRESGLVTKRIQGARGYARRGKDAAAQRFPALPGPVLTADAAARACPAAPLPAVIFITNGDGASPAPAYQRKPRQYARPVSRSASLERRV